MRSLLNGYLIAFVLFFVLPFLSWLVMMAKDSRRPHVRGAANCVHYSPQRDAVGDPVQAVGTCRQPECVRRIR